MSFTSTGLAIAAWRDASASSSNSAVVASTVLRTPANELSNSIDAATEAAPAAAMAAVRGSRASPASDIFLPMLLNSSPTAWSCTAETLANSLCSWASLLSFASVLAISRSRSRYCPAVASTLPSSISRCVSRRASSLSLVSVTASPKSFCFCVRSAMFFGSSFRSDATPFSSP